MKMLESIIEATLSFCQEQLGLEAKVTQANPPKDGSLLASIDVTTKNDEKYRIYLIAQREFVQKVAEIFLGEENSNEETIIDMAMECTNLIVGSAKVIASQKGIDFTIATPKIGQFDDITKEFDLTQKIECSNTSLYIALTKI